MQIRTRLTLLFLVLTASILAAVLFGVYWLYKTNTEQTFFKDLESKIDLAVETVLPNEATFRPVAHDWIAPEGDTLPFRDNISIFNNSYIRVFSIRRAAIPVSARDLQEIYQKGETRFKHYNLLALGKKAKTPTSEYVVIAEGYCDPSEVEKLSTILIFSFLIGVFLVSVSGWYYAGKSLQPVSQIVTEVEDIQPSNLSMRVATGNSQDELARMAEAFNHLLDRVERAFQMQRMFVSNVSHELKNPITAIRTQIEVTLQRERNPDAYRKALLSVLDDIRDLGETEQKLLQLARVYSNPQDIPFSPTRLDELLWVSMEQFKKQYPEYNSSVEFGDMPENEEDLLVSANEPLLRLAIINLMNNACKYASDHKVLLRLIFKANRRHEIEVCDQGPGIPDSEKSLIFEPFYRSPRHISLKGTGIGLSLVKNITNLHQIELLVENRPSGGTVFRLVFP